jgi:hypothetical protein
VTLSKMLVMLVLGANHDSPEVMTPDEGLKMKESIMIYWHA